MANSKKGDLLAKVTEYLMQHDRDPVAYPVDIKRIALHVGLARGTFYNWLKKADPEVQALFARIETAQEKARTTGGHTAVLTPASGPGSYATLSDPELARELEEGMRRAVNLSRQIIGVVERTTDVVEAPAVLAELHHRARMLNVLAADLEAPTAEIDRRRRLTTAVAVASLPGVESNAQSALWDDDADESE